MSGSASPAAVAASDIEGGPYRVMLVDDSAVIRGLLARTLESSPDIVIQASVGNGEQAIAALARHDVDVIVLDIEMPVMDGLTALPKLVATSPSVKIIMASTLTQRNAEISLRALGAGAADYIPKPTSTHGIAAAGDFKRDLVDKVLGLGAAARKAAASRVGRRRVAEAGGASLYDAEISLRPASRARPSVLAIGSSTGGPQALTEMLSHVPKDIVQPILVTQHMPGTFTAILARHLAEAAGRPSCEAVAGMPLSDGEIYVAPGGKHMVVVPTEDGPILQLLDTPPENFCKPAVDPMLRSLAEHFGDSVLCVILTGMGHDGLEGARHLINAGSTVIAQDEATSVVWGMPGAVATAGLCSAVLPLEEIGDRVATIARRRLEC